MKTLKDAVYGLAVGDALGVPFEFAERGSFHCKTMKGYGTHYQPPGTWSDDTSMTLATCDSMKHCHCIDDDDILKRFRAFINKGDYTPFGNAFDYGMTTVMAVQSGHGLAFEHSNGNGSLMRIIPLAFVNVTDQDIADISAITHAHHISKTACVLYVRIAKELLKGKSIMAAVNAVDNKYKIMPDGFKALPIIDVFSESEIRSTGYVVDTLEAAIWSVATTNTFKDAVLKAVNLGGDTDTIGAVTGALAGIIYGIEGIPKEWIDSLQNKELIDSCLF